MVAQRILGKTCVVTGGSSGIGLAIGRRFAAEGAQKVILVARNRSKLDRVKLSHEEKGLHRFEYVAGDVGSEACSSVLKEYMRDADVLVNAAGLMQSRVLVSTGTEEMHEILRTNLMGTILTCKNFVRHNASRTNREEGSTPCIINISSLLGVKGGRGATTYATSKAGVIGFSRALVAELGSFSNPKPVRVNTIVPGYIDTPMLDGFLPESREGLIKQIPLRRLGMPEEVADAAVFLASNQYANNCVLNLDGGLSAL